MADIRELPIHLVNKIAAGEVIERPASVVKELVENSVDALARRIDIVIEDGGKKLISVTDDGKGMDEKDLALAFQPHATSKIISEDDLESILTMGFRGEALASIASVARAKIISRTGDADGGNEISSSGTSAGSVAPAAAAKGTTVTIRDLFFNTPARRKFMRTSNTEIGHISEQVTRIALANTPITFTLSHNSRRSMELPATDSTETRIRDIFGNDLCEGLIPIVTRNDEVSVSGFIGRPDRVRASGKWQYFFLNGRYIRDSVLAHALREAYRGLADPSKRPLAFIFIEMDPQLADVNVHPTKIEVRFQDSQRMHSRLLASLKDTLNRANLTPSATLDADRIQNDGGAKSSAPADDDRRKSLREAMADFFKSSPPPQSKLDFSAPSNRRQYNAPPPAGGMVKSQPQSHGTGQDAATRHEHGTFVHNGGGQSQPVGIEATQSASASPKIMQVCDTYIISQDEDGLVIVDQHALHERILYNEIKRKLTDGSLQGQKLLIPSPFSVSHGEQAILSENAEILAKLGIETVSFGPNTAAIQRFPVFLTERGIEPADFIMEILDRISSDRQTDAEALLEDVLEMIACKAAVKSGDPLTPIEMEELLMKKDEVENASACPHGRPTTIVLSMKELARQFKRT